MKLSPQAHAALMMCLQKAIMEEIDIRPLLDDLDFVIDEEEPEFLVVTNPPSFKLNEDVKQAVEESSFQWKE